MVKTTVFELLAAGKVSTTLPPELCVGPGGGGTPGGCQDGAWALSSSQGATRAQREKVKEKQTLILFKEELSSNLCSLKMELADC